MGSDFGRETLIFSGHVVGNSEVVGSSELDGFAISLAPGDAQDKDGRNPRRSAPVGIGPDFEVCVWVDP